MNLCISTVGEEIRPILFGIRKVPQLDKLILVCSDETNDYAKKIYKYTNKIYDVDILKVSAINTSDIIEKILKRLMKINNPKNIYINLTGGTKIMSLSLFILSTFIKSSIFYIYKDSGNKMKYIKLPNLKLKPVIITPRRMEILEKISKESMTLTELSKEINVSKPTTSSFIKEFKKNNLVLVHDRKIYLSDFGKLTMLINKYGELYG